MALVIALAAALAWTLFDLARKQLSLTIPPMRLVWWLAVLVTPVYSALFLFSNEPWPLLGYWLPALVTIVLISVASVALTYALRVGQMSSLLPILSLTPVVAALLSWLWLSQSLSLWQWGAILTIVLSVFLMQGDFSLRMRPGVWPMMTAALCWGASIVFDQQALRYADPFWHAALQSAGMVLVVGVVMVLRRDGFVYRGSVWLLLAAALVFMLAVMGQLFALQLLHPGIVETLKRGVGIMGAALWGILLYQERLTARQGMLMVLICAMIAVLILHE
ncbi:MAG: DMT family transporter [Bacterioplanes sp.]|nr:DMT family transporter [Bacterioplanes sp.]